MCALVTGVQTWAVPFSPDLTSLDRIVAGGLRGGAVCGRKAILDHLDFDAATAKGFEKIGHQGMFNANAMSAAAGIATLEIVAETDACERANAHADKLDRKSTRLNSSN